MFSKKFVIPTWSELFPNVKSGVTVSLISIPLSISLAVASGATPLQGILTAIWACMIAGFVGSSNYNIFGPAGALTALLMAFYGVTNDVYTLPLLAIVVGIWSLIIWCLKLTKYITLIPSTALHGFIAGVSLTIAFGQLPNAFGIINLTKHESVLANIWELGVHLGSTNLVSLGIFFVCLTLLIIWKKKITFIPGPIPIALLGIVLGWMMHNGIIHWDVQLLSTKFPDLTFSLAQFDYVSSLRTHLSDWNFWKEISVSGFMIAAIAILETIISAKIADKMTSTKCNPDQETFAVAGANLIGGLLGGLPTTAVLIRTALNVKSGATSWISAVIAGCAVLIISWLGFDYFQMIPMAVIAAILVNIALGLLDFNHYRHVYHFDRFDAFVLIIVALLTFLIDPIYGILGGVAISLLSHLKRSMQAQMYVTVFDRGSFVTKTLLHKYMSSTQEGDMVVVKLGSEITFLSVSAIEQSLGKLLPHHRLILSFSHVEYIDLDGVDAIDDLMKYLDAHRISYAFCGLSGYLKHKIGHLSGYQTLAANDHIYYATSEAIDRFI